MANLNKWAGAPTSRSTVLTTELNALANAAFSAAGTAYDNTTNLDQTGWVEVNLSSLTPTTGAQLVVFMLLSQDGTNYEDAPSASNPGFACQNVTASVSTGVGAKRVSIGPFTMPPGKCKFVLQNKTNVALGATGSTATLYTGDSTNNG